MNKTQKTLQLALSALERAVDKMTDGQRYTDEGQALLDALFDLREALAEQPEPATWPAPDLEIEYQYDGGTHWCPLGPAERMRPDFPGVYRIKPGKYPTPAQQQEPVAERHERRVEAHNNVYATGVTVDRMRLAKARQGLHSEGDTVGWCEAYFAIDRLHDLAEQPASKPLTVWEKEIIWKKHKRTLGGWDHGGTEVIDDNAFDDVVRDIEAAHGITGEQK